jgi:hypothetical protein
VHQFEGLSAAVRQLNEEDDQPRKDDRHGCKERDCRAEADEHGKGEQRSEEQTADLRSRQHLKAVYGSRRCRPSWPPARA